MVINFYSSIGKPSVHLNSLWEGIGMIQVNTFTIYHNIEYVNKPIAFISIRNNRGNAKSLIALQYKPCNR